MELLLTMIRSFHTPFCLPACVFHASTLMETNTDFNFETYPCYEMILLRVKSWPCNISETFTNIVDFFSIHHTWQLGRLKHIFAVLPKEHVILDRILMGSVTVPNLFKNKTNKLRSQLRSNPS